MFGGKHGEHEETNVQLCTSEAGIHVIRTVVVYCHVQDMRNMGTVSIAAIHTMNRHSYGEERKDNNKVYVTIPQYNMCNNPTIEYI